jgi:hypothetical protein
MIPIHVALVAYKCEDPSANLSTILRVAAALQMQLTRDFTPIWGIPAVVSGFESLEEVPPACMPLLIVTPGSLESREHAFHLTENGQPMAFVEAGAGWSLPASHELLEMVCDPFGKTKVMGESIADHADAKSFIPAAKDYREPQGQVAYLLEICDPCQASHYTVNGFQVSDFVTPEYYAPGAPTGGRYSFTGKVTKPRQVLDGGYITWYTSIPGAPIWQAIKDTNGDLQVGPMPGPTSSYTRHDVDYVNDFLGDLDSTIPRSVPANRAEELAREAAKRNGKELERDLERVLKSYEPSVDLQDFLAVLYDLAYEKDVWLRYNGNPQLLLDRLKSILREPLAFVGTELPKPDQYKAVYEPLKKLKDRQPKLSSEAAITAMHGTTIWAPPVPPPHS